MGKVTAAAREKLERLRVQGRDGANQKEVFICWDIENARPPLSLPVAVVERAITNAFQYLQRRKRAGFVASVSSISLRDLVRTYGQWQVDYLVGAVETVLAPGGPKSGSTDAKLLQRVNAFIQAQSASGAAPRSVLVLLTGDDDFTAAARAALDAGMELELLHPGVRHTSGRLLSAVTGRANAWHADFHDFLEYWTTSGSSTAAREARGAPPAPAACAAGLPGSDSADSDNLQEELRARLGPTGGSGQAAQAAQVQAEAAGGSGSGSGGGRKRRRPVDDSDCEGAAAAGHSGSATEPAAPAAAEAEPEPGAESSGGGGGLAPACFRLRLSRLRPVRGAADPGRALAAAGDWLEQQRRSGGEMYRGLVKLAGECGCELAMGSSASARSTSGLAGLGRDCWLRLSCGHDVGEDAEHCRRIAKRAWHRLRQELEGALAQQAVLTLGRGTEPTAGAGAGAAGAAGAAAVDVAVAGTTGPPKTAAAAPAAVRRARLYLASLPAVLGAADRAAALQAMGDWLRDQKARRTACYEGLCRIAADWGCKLEVPCAHGAGLHQAAMASIILRVQPGSSRSPVIALTAALERLRGALSKAWSGAVKSLQAARARTGPGAAGTGTAAGSRAPRMLVGRAAAGNQLPPRAPLVPPGSGPGSSAPVRLASNQAVTDAPSSQWVPDSHSMFDWLQQQASRRTPCYKELLRAVSDWGCQLVVPSHNKCRRQGKRALTISLKHSPTRSASRTRTVAVAIQRLQKAVNKMWLKAGRSTR